MAAERRNAHPYHMYDAIQQQPDTIRRILQEEGETASRLAAVIKQATDIHVVGIGTSWHACLVGESLFHSIAHRNDARAWNSFEYTSHPPPLTKSSVVIVLSHRGTKQFSLSALQLAKDAGATTALITGLNSAAKVELCDFVFRTSLQEKSSAFTFSHSGAIAVLFLIAIAVGKLSSHPLSLELEARISDLPDLVTRVLAQEAAVRDLVEKVKESQIIYFVGYGVNTSTAYEGALKIKEACYVYTEGFQLEQYLHGPICATDERSTVVFIDSSPDANSLGASRTQELVEYALAVGSRVISLTAAPHKLQHEKYFELPLPESPEPFTAISSLVFVQLFTYLLSLAKGTNPDVFRRDNPLVANASAAIKL